MRNLFKVFVLGFFVAFLFTSCGKQPTQEISQAEAAVNDAIKEGADVYAKEELKKLQDDLAAAMEEVNTQGKKVFKKYGNAKKMLLQVKTDAEALKATIPAKKEQAKNDALKALDEAKVAVEEAKALLAKAPKGKGTKADIEAFTADLKGLEDMLTEVQQGIDTEDYFGATDKAKIIKEKAISISDQIKAAIEKVKR